MSFVSGTTGNEAAQKFLDVLQSDFKNLGIETKKKYPQIKEVRMINLWCRGDGKYSIVFCSTEKIDSHYPFNAKVVSSLLQAVTSLPFRRQD